MCCGTFGSLWGAFRVMERWLKSNRCCLGFRSVSGALNSYYFPSCSYFCLGSQRVSDASLRETRVDLRLRQGSQAGPLPAVPSRGMIGSRHIPSPYHLFGPLRRMPKHYHATCIPYFIFTDITSSFQLNLTHVRGCLKYTIQPNSLVKKRDQ